MDDELMKCPTCGTPRVSRYAAYCHECGSPLPELPPGPDDPAGPAASYPTGQGGGYVPGPVRQDFSGVQQPGQAPAGNAGQPSQGVPPAQAGPVRVYERPETPPSVVKRRRLTWILMGVGLLISLLLLAFGPLRSVLGARNQPAWTPPGKETVGAETVATLPPGVSAAQATARARYTATFTPSPTVPVDATEATGGNTGGSGGASAGAIATVALPTLAPATVAPSASPAPPNAVAPTAVAPTHTAVPPAATAVPPTAVAPTATAVPPAASPTPASATGPITGVDLPGVLAGGKAVAFMSDRSGSPQIWVTGSGGGNQVQVTYEGQNTSPAWSLDDRYLYYVSSRGGQTGVYRLDITTGAEEQVLNDPSIVSARPLANGQLATLRTEGGRYALYVGDRRVFQLDRSFQFQFSVDGRRALIDPNADPRTISVVDVASTKAREVAPAKSWNAGWGPGDRLTFVSDRSGIASVYIAGPNGEEARAVSPADKWSQAPAFSSDGSMIAFISGDGPAWNVYAVDANGKNPHKVANAANPGKSPVWQPGGQLLAFETNRAGNWDIYVTDPGGGERVLVDDPGNDVDPAWTW